MSDVTIKLDRRVYKQARGAYEKYHFDVGVLQDRPHFQPGKGKKTLAGGPARRTGRKESGMSVSQVSESLRKNTGINFYTQPFQSRKNKDILNFTKSFFKLCGGRAGEKRRTENLLQAVVRNPIVRGDYGNNSKLTATIKGFNRLMIDTGQLFKAIQAKVVQRVSR